MHLVARPEEIRLDASGFELPLAERLYLGDRIELRLDWAGTTVRAMVPVASAESLQPGSRVKLALGRFTVLPA